MQNSVIRRKAWPTRNIRTWTAPLARLRVCSIGIYGVSLQNLFLQILCREFHGQTCASSRNRNHSFKPVQINEAEKSKVRVK